MNDIYKLISVFEKTSIVKVVCGVDFRRFSETIDELEENLIAIS